MSTPYRVCTAQTLAAAKDKSKGSAHFFTLHREIVEDGVATRRAPTLFDECFKSLQISLDALRHHFQCLPSMFGEP